jgi:hypothetical protein
LVSVAFSPPALSPLKGCRPGLRYKKITSLPARRPSAGALRRPVSILLGGKNSPAVFQSPVATKSTLGRGIARPWSGREARGHAAYSWRGSGDRALIPYRMGLLFHSVESPPTPQRGKRPAMLEQSAGFIALLGQQLPASLRFKDVVWRVLLCSNSSRLSPQRVQSSRKTAIWRRLNLASGANTRLGVVC